PRPRSRTVARAPARAARRSSDATGAQAGERYIPRALDPGGLATRALLGGERAGECGLQVVEVDVAPDGAGALGGVQQAHARRVEHAGAVARRVGALRSCGLLSCAQSGAHAPYTCTGNPGRAPRL